jgi:DNA ligase-1
MTDKPFRPLLACETPKDFTDLERYGHFPLFGSYKLDGIRATLVNGQLVSRTGKPLPSAYTKKFALPELGGLDGELLAENVPEGLTVYQAAYSAVMTHDSMEPLRWVVFDYISSKPYRDRFDKVLHSARRFKNSIHEIEVLEQRYLPTLEAVFEMEQEALDLGHEGLIIRRGDAPYKQGRSTLKQGYLIKIARRLTGEAIVIGFEELMHNDNPAKLNEVGYTKRSSNQENLRPSGMLGSFIVRDVKTNVEFNVGIGEGLDHNLRREILQNQDKYLHRIMKYDYKPYGTAEKPRQSRWLGWRDPSDM